MSYWNNDENNMWSLFKRYNIFFPKIYIIVKNNIKSKNNGLAYDGRWVKHICTSLFHGRTPAHNKI